MDLLKNDSTIEPTENTERMSSFPGTLEQRHGADDSLLSIWDTEGGRENAFERTMLFLQNQIEQLVSSGVDAFHRSEKAARELKALKEELKNKDEELERTRLSEQKSRATVAVSKCLCVRVMDFLCVITPKQTDQTSSFPKLLESSQCPRSLPRWSLRRCALCRGRSPIARRRERLQTSAR